MRNTNTRPTPTQSLDGIALTGASTASQRRSLAVFAPVTLTVPALCFLPFRSIVPYALCSPMSIIRYELAAQSDSLHALSLWRTNATSTTESSLPTRADRVNRAETPGCAPCSGIRSEPRQLLLSLLSWRSNHAVGAPKATGVYCVMRTILHVSYVCDITEVFWQGISVTICNEGN